MIYKISLYINTILCLLRLRKAYFFYRIKDGLHSSSLFELFDQLFQFASDRGVSHA